jgi:hypothetical protein
MKVKKDEEIKKISNENFYNDDNRNESFSEFYEKINNNKKMQNEEQNFDLILDRFWEETKLFLNNIDFQNFAYLLDLDVLFYFLEENDILKNVRIFEDFKNDYFKQQTNYKSLEKEIKIKTIKKVLNNFILLEKLEKKNFDNFFDRIFENNFENKKSVRIFGIVSNFFVKRSENEKLKNLKDFVSFQNFLFLKENLKKYFYFILQEFDFPIQKYNIKKKRFEESLDEKLSELYKKTNFYENLKKKLHTLYDRKLDIFQNQKKKILSKNINDFINTITITKLDFFEEIEITLKKEYSYFIIDTIFKKEMDDNFSKKLDLILFDDLDECLDFEEINLKIKEIIQKEMTSVNIIGKFDIDKNHYSKIINNLFLARFNLLQKNKYFGLDVDQEEEIIFINKIDKLNVIGKEIISFYLDLLKNDKLKLYNEFHFENEPLMKIYLDIDEEKFLILLINLCKIFFNFTSKNFNKNYIIQKESFFDFLSNLKFEIKSMTKINMFYFIMSNFLNKSDLEYESNDITQYLKFKFKKRIEFFNISRIENFISKELVFSISGFLSENDKENKKNEWFDLSKHLPYIEHITLNWQANNKTGLFLKVLDTMTDKNKLSDKISNLLTNSAFEEAYNLAQKTGENLSEIFIQKDFFEDKIINIISFSLGTIVTFHFLISLAKNQIFIENKFIIGDICLMGSCVDILDFLNSVHLLIGSQGIVKNKLKIVFSKSDYILAVFFKFSKVDKNALGYIGVSIKDICLALKKNDLEFKEISLKNIKLYVEEKVEIFDFSDLDLGHTYYRNHLPYILKKIDFMTNHRKDLLENFSFN